MSNFWLALVCSIHIGCVELQTPTREACIYAIPEGIAHVIALERRFLYGESGRDLLDMTTEDIEEHLETIEWTCRYLPEEGPGVSISFPNRR